jgi:glycosyltransferase involved in cell wall biosynthesis
MIKKYILVGAKPQDVMSTNPGGQLTASLGLISYADSFGHEIEVIDTTQSSFPVPPMKERLKRGLSRLKQLWTSLKSGSVSGVIIFSSSGFSFYERIALSATCRLFRVPDIFFVRSGHFYNELKLSFVKRCIAGTLLKIPRIIGAQGQDWVDFYNSLGVSTSRTVIVRNWLSNDFPVSSELKVCSDSTTLKFVFVGWLVKEKGVPELLEAALQLSGKFKFELHLIGGGTLEGYCKEYVQTNNLQNNIVLHGWKESDEVIETLKYCHVFVLPSIAEGFPNALLEAMAMGLPSICTNVGGVADSLKNGENGFLLNSNSVPSLVSAMTAYLKHPELIKQHSYNTLHIYLENHNQEKNCELLFNQFRNK